jgi:hypothetical protein
MSVASAEPAQKSRRYYTVGTPLKEGVRVEIVFLEPISDIEDEFVRLVRETWEPFGGKTKINRRPSTTIVQVDYPKDAGVETDVILQFTQDCEQYLDERQFSRVPLS